jgi:phytoene synthase
MIKKEDVLYCKNINRKFGKSYFFATQFFPKNLREATYVLYAFYRLPDEIVDNQKTNPGKELEEYINEWKEIVKGKESKNQVLRATLEVHKKYNIPFEYSIDFLEAMKQDLTKSRYENFDELKEYIYGSATCVGYMMSYVIGFEKENQKDVLKYAEYLGIAMQMTNFLRDIKEDFEMRNRIYLPQNDMNDFGITEKDVKEEQISEDFMKFQIERCRNFYKEAEKKVIPLLNKRGRFAVLMASKLYSEILREIEKQNYNIFKGRAKVSFFRKMVIMLKTII